MWRRSRGPQPCPGKRRVVNGSVVTKALAAPAHTAGRLIAARAGRGFADGVVSIFLADYLRRLGLSAFEVGTVVTATLLGSATLTLLVGMYAHRVPARRILLSATLLMAATGVGFALARDFWLLLLIGFVGTLNPSAGDVSVFLPTEQALLSAQAEREARTALFARYTLAGTLCGAFGALVSGMPEIAARQLGWSVLNGFRAAFVVYSAVAVVLALLYRSVPWSEHRDDAQAAPLRRARKTVFRLTALFALDSFGGGFAVDSMLALWLSLRFELPLPTSAAVFFGARLLSASSQLLSPILAARFGLIETMVFTHIPANLFLIAAACMPNAGLAILCLLLRMALSQMDVPARQSYVMAVVPPEERAAAASVTNVPRSLATALSPLLAGAMLQNSSFGWPLIAAGGLKLVYDLLLLAMFRQTRPAW